MAGGVDRVGAFNGKAGQRDAGVWCGVLVNRELSLWHRPGRGSLARWVGAACAAVGEFALCLDRRRSLRVGPEGGSGAAGRLRRGELEAVVARVLLVAMR